MVGRELRPHHGAVQRASLQPQCAPHSPSLGLRGETRLRQRSPYVLSLSLWVDGRESPSPHGFVCPVLSPSQLSRGKPPLNRQPSEPTSQFQPALPSAGRLIQLTCFAQKRQMEGPRIRIRFFLESRGSLTSSPTFFFLLLSSLRHCSFLVAGETLLPLLTLRRLSCRGIHRPSRAQ